MIGEDLLALAEERYLESFAVVFLVGALQGGMLARGVRRRFPSLRSHARAASAIMLILLLANATLSALRFAAPERVDLAGLSMPSTPDELAGSAARVLGIDGGFWSTVAILITVTLMLISRAAELPAIARYFVLAISVMTFLVALAARFAGYVPTEFHVAMYSLYHVGIAAGAFLVMRRGPPRTGLE
ncbi:MAG: hypothetical protein OXU86_04960 [Thaumarchaeota archaeon]|nr:hypothetical protein [Nitrososphaerota archaeon]